MATPYPTYVFTPTLTPDLFEVNGPKTNQVNVAPQNPNQTVTQSATLKTISTWLPANAARNVVASGVTTFTLYGTEAVNFDAVYGPNGLAWFTHTQL